MQVHWYTEPRTRSSACAIRPGPPQAAGPRRIATGGRHCARVRCAASLEHSHEARCRPDAMPGLVRPQWAGALPATRANPAGAVAQAARGPASATSADTIGRYSSKFAANFVASSRAFAS